MTLDLPLPNYGIWSGFKIADFGNTLVGRKMQRWLEHSKNNFFITKCVKDACLCVNSIFLQISNTKFSIFPKPKFSVKITKMSVSTLITDSLICMFFCSSGDFWFICNEVQQLQMPNNADWMFFFHRLQEQNHQFPKFWKLSPKRYLW